ncbi:M50 family metallopeptidase [Occultella gossypii]|uniref:Site-2 protease family protein n=1 Tax=Occultella gossypii TaxID=2800820 RepID=A0ABS7S8K1_9MICO|nr:site-2 protease family protein [Occultella gossypii]MBZ2195954.1 site-2 protease family protein [Occultella gossypii]
MDFWLGVLFVAVGLIISIALHEIGHLVPAKLFGVKVSQYFVGFGRTLWSTKRGETEYGIKMLPLGGYVRMVGMFPPAREEVGEDTDGRPAEARLRRRGLRGLMDSMAEDARSASAQEIGEELADGQRHRVFYQLSTPKKLAVMFGGPVVNLIISTVLFAIILTAFGTATASNRISSVSECVVPVTEQRECAAGDAESPAAMAGFEAGDRIVSWNGEPVTEWADISTSITDGGTEAATVVVDRGGEEVTLTVTPVLEDRPVVEDGAVVTDADGEPVLAPVPFVGISAAYELVPQPLSAVPAFVGSVFTGTVDVVISLPQRLVAIAQAVFGTEERDPGVVGLIGVGRFAGEIASIDSADYGAAERTADLLSLVASLNMALFVFNMIPLLPLDGGHIAGALFEGARRRLAQAFGRPDPGHADTAKLMPLTYLVIIVLGGMSLLLAFADIVKPVTLG